jgi:hypothetical protein
MRLVGLGGILAQFLETLLPDSPLYLIDGDTFELHNRARMSFTASGTKPWAPPYEEVYLDILLGHVLPVTRQMVPEADG